MNIGIVGNGFVGKATSLFGCKDEYADNEDVAFMIYDIDEKKRVPKDVRLEDLAGCDLVFICVPTPMREDGSCSTDIVEQVINQLKDLVPEEQLKLTDHLDLSPIVVRSTVPAGFCRKHGVSFMPEFLTEANWENDFKNCKQWVIGLNDVNNKQIKKIIRKLFLIAKRNKRIEYPTLNFVSTESAELSKLARNSFLATKVSFFNEISELCSSLGIDYESVREMTCLDDRIGQSHSAVPGPDGKGGFGGTCFPKDTSSLYSQMSDAGMESYIIEAAVSRNKQVDRKEQDWKDDKGRAVV